MKVRIRSPGQGCAKADRDRRDRKWGLPSESDDDVEHARRRVGDVEVDDADWYAGAEDDIFRRNVFVADYFGLDEDGRHVVDAQWPESLDAFGYLKCKLKVVHASLQARDRDKDVFAARPRVKWSTADVAVDVREGFASAPLDAEKPRCLGKARELEVMQVHVIAELCALTGRRTVSPTRTTPSVTSPPASAALLSPVRARRRLSGS